MRKLLCALLAGALAFGLTSCGAPALQTPAAGPTATPARVETQAPAVVAFSDPVLEAKVRETMGKPDGDITLEEAAAVTGLNLSIEWQPSIPPETQIRNIGGLEHFTNLENLDLSFHAIGDIAPLAGLTKLRSLSLGGNQVADIAPLSGLTNLTWLTLFNCIAEDYAPLASLVNLDGIMLDHSTIRDLSVLSGLERLQRVTLTHTQVGDVSPLAALTQLRALFLEECPIEDYSPLANIYPNLEEKDFAMALSLAELGFARIDHDTTAGFKTGEMSISVNHSEWGVPTMELEANSVRMSLHMDGGYTLVVGYHPDIQAYVFSVSRDGGAPTDYVYDPANGGFTFASGGRESAEQILRAALGETKADDILLAPIPIFNDTIRTTFGIDADALYALPFDRATLKGLGFVPDRGGAACVYEQNGGDYVRVSVHRPEWGDQEWDVEFFTSVNGYGVMIWYYMDEQRFYVKADNPADGSYADFEFLLETMAANDGAASNGMTVEEYFKRVYNNPDIENIVYIYSVKMVQHYIDDTFGMSIDELYALPAGA